MPMKVTPIALAAGDTYATPFVGPLNYTAPVQVNIANLTTFEVDALGWLKPGVPLNRNGGLYVGVLSTPGAAVDPAPANTGNGSISAIVGKVGGVSETITITMLTATTFSVVGSVSGAMANGAALGAYTSAIINFTITAGGTAFIAGDNFTIAVVSATVPLFGCTIEPIKLAKSNSVTDRVGTFTVAVATRGQINRDLLEDILGRVLTADEAAGFDRAGSNLTLIT